MKTIIHLFLFFAMVTFCAHADAQERKKIAGTVQDSLGRGLPNVSVHVKSTKIGTVTDGRGNFTVAANATDVLEFSSVGYETQELSVGNNTNISITLKSVSNALNEVVVTTAFGIQKQAKSLGYATATVKSDELVKTSSTNFGSALYGKAAGVKIATAPGGSLGGVAITIRGINSLTQRTQPLIVLDGVPLHDGDFNNGNYWGDQRLRGNGLLDINPENVESITILKGASAAALYGSEATNGVILITTKKGKSGSEKFSVDFNTSYFQDRVAYLPRFQTVRGAGSPVQYDWFGEDENGFNENTYTIDGQEYRALVQGSVNFGPKFDGQPIATWTGRVANYSPIKNGWAHLYQHANNVVTNVAFNFSGQNSNTRFSIAHQRYEGVSLNSSDERFNVNLNSIYNFGKKFRLNLIANDIYSTVKNRPYLNDRLINNFSGMMPTFDDGNWYRKYYKTSLGYKYVTGSNESLTPDENITIPNYRTDILDYVWNTMENKVTEGNNRLMASLTGTLDITKNLQLRGRLATDFTNNQTESRNSSSVPVVYGYSGYYGISTYRYSILYGDALLTYTGKINEGLTIKAMAGYTGDKESSYSTSIGTNGGLTTENRFDLTSSATTPYSSSSTRTYLTKDALIGTVNASYKDYLFIEGTVRRDRTSTMNPDNNSFVYPSANAAFVISDAFNLPQVISNAKLRASWGIVGNYPSAYQANVAYTLTNLGDQGSGSVLATSAATGTYGNDLIKPEQKHELEFGLEAGFFNQRLKLDLAYYKAKIVDMIIPLQIAQTTGAGNILANVGTLQNQGIDLSITATPVQGRNFWWETGINFNNNNNKILKLTTGSTELVHSDYDGNAAVLKSVVGRPIGDFYAHPILTDDKGEKVVTDFGDGDIVYQIDASILKRYGNSQVKATGGFYNTFSYKGFSLELYTDYRIGGYVMPTGLFWMTSRGLTKESLTAMDAAHGGISYYKDASGRGIETSASSGPNGETVYHDGMKLGGVFADGTTNDYVTSQFYYYNETYNWGGPQYSNSQYFRYIVKNTYWKMREISLAYTLPQSISRKIRANKLQLSVFGRNLFYLYRTIKDMDAEQLTAGLNWNQSLTNAGSQPSTRTFGVSLRATF
ncbi:SusC/RagA family TonB-linked outer membrane protein [Parafilimonas sp.]|uniref:SusC/RagA family TonB-linked outer membrane protein n=1 Tax=Parafilimonas sp. TaxID=1969739 RepID=UPI0039E3C45E